MKALLSAACLLVAIVPAQGITILQPTPGQTVQGTASVTGVTSGFASGTVSVSIDGGAFVPAQGLQNWSFAWDTSAVANGLHLIRARIRDFPNPPSFDSVFVDVQNNVGLQIAISSPGAGTTVPPGFVVTGTATQATTVELSVDSGPFAPVNGLAEWHLAFAPGTLSHGLHTLTARASSGAQVLLDSVSVTVGVPPAGSSVSTYVSSVDGQPLTARIRVPPGYDPAVPRPLLVYLHGAGGSGAAMTNNAALLAELDARGWIGVAPDGRQWGLASQGCGWQYSPAYVDNPDPNVGPGEQDILDAVDFYAQAYGTDLDRIYLSGFSFGGRGAYIIGLKNPDRFAAIAPLGPAIDMYEVYDRRTTNIICREGITGGEPGDSDVVDTMYTITSGRFLVENAYNLPVFHGHGLFDTVTSNTLSNAPFLHGFHITTDTTWSGCHGTTNMCFGHTPTLNELRALHPDGYDWAYCFTQIGHSTDDFWFVGGSPPNGAVGTADPNVPGHLIGMFDFLEQHELVRAPDTIVYKTYTDTHRNAYWLSLDSSTAWQDIPAAVRAHRDPAANELSVEAVRAATVGIDIEQAELLLAPGAPLTINIAELLEPVFDPALQLMSGEQLEPTFELVGDFTANDWVEVTRDGVLLDPALLSQSAQNITVGPLTIASPTTLVVTGYRSFVDLGFGLAGALGTPELTATGTTVAGSTVEFSIDNLQPNMPGLLVLGSQTIFAPVLGGTLVPLPSVTVGFATDGVGAATIAATWPSLAPGTSLFLQAAVLDTMAPQFVAASNALQAIARP